ncbi:hypothetical protein BD769DRAFT_254381 [Suillus cothurnatus]|nr:hypothetical protein BD769DRAFT_254381 [Suillus cothurnatus]
MLSARKAATVWLFLTFKLVLTAQIPLLSHAPVSFYPGVENDLGQWDLDQAPAVNATGHLVFETANSLLQHWANTRLPYWSYNSPRDHSCRHTTLPWSHYGSPFTDLPGLGSCRARPLHNLLPWANRNRMLASHPCSYSANESTLF